MAATQGMAQPSTKKRSFLLRDFFKLFRAISRVLPREKPNHTHKASKHERKPRTKSKRHEEQIFNVPDDPNAFRFQEAKSSVANKVEAGANFCKVRSYRFDNSVGTKKASSAFSRSCSQNTATTNPNLTMRSLSFIGRNKTDSNGFVPTLMRSTTTVPRSLANPILYSSSSAKVAKPQATEKKLSCTLEELCNGCTKKIKIKRDVITTSGQLSEEEETVEIKVKPGWKEGTKVTFEGKGNEAMGSVPADLTFVIVEKEHEVFKREGDDLEMEVEVSLLEALTGFEFCVALPDGDKMSLKIKDVIHPGYVTAIEGKGMPNTKEKGKKRGDLRVRFRTKFPQQLTDGQRAEIQSILQQDSS
ncbi:HSP40/DnaJ peptide-binding protein [Raphanus sativus]|uniref:Protein psi1 n=1 Tax=Raphanus sativus TaxID=3726 RepID=A0A6J0NQT2_RAPSA|nr:protein psi1 [Raphanus sativus]KAJ4896522.1 HSP40/DnaJ peptide-binding protein [Raphanus sativus]